MNEEQSVFDIHDYFFVIDSDNIETICSKMYGFAFVDGILTESADDLNGKTLTGDGAYVYICRNGEQITLQQDFICFL